MESEELRSFVYCVQTRPGSCFYCTPGTPPTPTGKLREEGIGAGSSQCSCLASPVVTQKGSNVALVEVKAESS